MVRTVTQYPNPVEVLESGLWIPLRSGHRLAARLWRPVSAQQQPVPALLEFLPYRKRDQTRGRDEPIHHYFAGHGYASIRVDMRGSGDSFGVMRDEYERQEQDDALEVIEWLAKQPWCTGRVGMFGISWGGFNSLQVAARRPPALRAIVTSCSTDDRYTDDMHYMGGCLLNDNLDWATNFFGMLPMPGDPEIMGDGWRANWQERLAVIEPPAHLWMQHPWRDAYWKHGSVNEDFSSIECPVFAHGGWLDGYSNAVLRLLAHLKVPSIGLIGPHAHQFGFEDRAPGPAYGLLQEALRWWDYWLKDLPTGILDEPRLRVFMGDDIPATAWYETCPGRWVAETQWPSPRIQRKTLFLNRDGLAEGRRKSEVLQHISRQTIGLAAGEWCPYGTGGTGPEFSGDQRADDAFSLVFDSQALPDRLEILGAPSVTLDLAVDRPCAFVAVRLSDVKADGSVTRVTFGLLNLAHRDSSEHPQPLEPGKPYRVRIQLNDCAYSFAPGHRLRVSLSTAYWPMVWPSPQIVTLSIHPGTSHLELPVRPRAGEPSMAPLAGPEAAPAMAKHLLEPAPNRNTLVQDLQTGRVEVRAERGSGYFRIEDNRIEHGRNVIENMSITEGDPLSARSEVIVQTRTGRAGSIVDVRVSSRLTANLTTFTLESSLVVTENGREVHTREWNHEIERKLV